MMMMMTMATTMTMTTMMMRVMMTTIIITVTIIAIIMISSTIIDCLHIVCVSLMNTIRRPCGVLDGLEVKPPFFPPSHPNRPPRRGGGFMEDAESGHFTFFPAFASSPPPFPSPLPPTPHPPHPCVSKTGSIWKLLIMSLIGGIHTEI